MPNFYSLFCLILDIAPLGWAPLFLLPVLIIGIVLVAVVILVRVIRNRQKGTSAKLEKRRDKDSGSKEQ